MPLILPTVLIGASFGVAATTSGWGVVAPVVMSVVVFSGAVQIAVVSVLAAGGSVAAAVTAAGLIASRLEAIGIAIGPSLRGGPVRRALEGQAVVDASLVLARIGEARCVIDRGRPAHFNGALNVEDRAVVRRVDRRGSRTSHFPMALPCV